MTNTRAALSCALLVLYASTAHAERPLWEAGIGLGGVSIPEYRGSDEQTRYVLPIPYVIYRGKRLNVDRRGMRGLLFASDTFALNISGDLGVPVDSDQNSARAGMEDLNFMLHLGPSLEFTLHEEDNHGDVLKLKIPAQAVISMDLSDPGTRGWFFYPHLNYIIAGRWTLGTAIGPVFATREYHQYYYGVKSTEASSARSAYSASGGYSGMRASMSLNRRIGRTWLGAFIRYENLSGAVYEDSPLVRSNNSLVSGIGVSWVFARSIRAAPDTPLSEPDTL